MAYNELGVIAFANESFEEASQLFYHALGLVRKLEGGDEPEDLGFVVDVKDIFWEPTINNLGHCFRRLERFQDAIFCHEAAWNLTPLPSTTAALAFARHMDGDVEYAIEGYHNALGANPGDQFCQDMLNRALQEAATGGIDDLLAGTGPEGEGEGEDTSEVMGSSIGEGSMGINGGGNDSSNFTFSSPGEKSQTNEVRQRAKTASVESEGGELIHMYYETINDKL